MHGLRLLPDEVRSLYSNHFRGLQASFGSKKSDGKPQRFDLLFRPRHLTLTNFKLPEYISETRERSALIKLFSGANTTENFHNLH